MTEEEKKAVDKINKLVEYLRKWNENFTIVPADIKYFEKILDMIKTYIRMIDENIEEILEQSKEIEELKEDSCCMTNCVRRDKEKLFLEDKIKAKIEERNKWLQEYDEQEEMNELQKDDYRLIKVERNVLQSLLEKEK